MAAPTRDQATFIVNIEYSAGILADLSPVNLESCQQRPYSNSSCTVLCGLVWVRMFLYYTM